MRGERQRFLNTLRQPSACHWSWQSRRDCGAERGEEVKKPWRGGRITQAPYLKPNSLSFTSFCFPSCSLSANFPLLFLSCAHTVSLNCAHIPMQRSGVFTLRLNSHHPFSLLSSPLHPTCRTLNIPRSIFTMLSLLFALALSSWCSLFFPFPFILLLSLSEEALLIHSPWQPGHSYTVTHLVKVISGQGSLSVHMSSMGFFAHRVDLSAVYWKYVLCGKHTQTYTHSHTVYELF